MKKTRRRNHFVLGASILCSFLVVSLWMLINDQGVLYRVAAPILMFSGFGNYSNSHRIDCYFQEKKNILSEISSVRPRRSSSIFFHETSCGTGKEGGISLTPRQACAVESAAKMNPDSEVYLLFTAPISSDNVSEWSPALRELVQYSNIRVMHLNFEKYFQDTPLEDWYHGGALKDSRWPRSHASDVLRFLTLWKYGGTYLDLDVVVTRSLSNMQNFAGAESWVDVAAGVLNFAAEGVGHIMASACLHDLRTEFRGDVWGNNGPGVITRVLKRVCGVEEIQEMTPEQCHGFTVQPPNNFYAIPWRQWHLFFDESKSNRTMARIADSYAIHVWNKFSIAENVNVGSRQPYGLIAEKFCPRVYSNCGPVF